MDVMNLSDPTDFCGTAVGSASTSSGTLFEPSVGGGAAYGFVRSFWSGESSVKWIGLSIHCAPTRRYWPRLSLAGRLAAARILCTLEFSELTASSGSIVFDFDAGNSREIEVC